MQVRGAKMMVRYYSHEAADLQPALEMLKGQSTEDHGVCVCMASLHTVVLLKT